MTVRRGDRGRETGDGMGRRDYFKTLPLLGKCYICSEIIREKETRKFYTLHALYLVDELPYLEDEISTTYRDTLCQKSCHQHPRHPGKLPSLHPQIRVGCRPVRCDLHRPRA